MAILGATAGLLGLLTACGSKPASEAVAAPAPPPAPHAETLDPDQPRYDDRPNRPTATPTAPPTCPGSGVYVQAEEPSAAMGLRAMSLKLTNCGKRTYTLKGYPTVRVLDEDGKPLDVRVKHGSAGIATLDHFDAAPKQVTLRPKETAVAGLVWRNTVTDPTTQAVNGQALDVAPAQGSPRQTVTELIDLGNTGKLGVSPWYTPEQPSTATPTSKPSPRRSAWTATQ
ncbi:DUF4232 domain-containing protein [Streptomyces sp. NBS 14/10]|uniref:DUF4232 domain-containing protein n=1 Tax=Streptomyces sp. NBS 14/10 TaxID=1945643 RepID=UPI0015C64E44|nr:DUF4232 domain-containing protein [Streptomyces sp. NBS 14/10]KAK1178907.1 DUF4232 domain-containing protein [Streptomyces sp. NBS 14/10]NUP41047.1 DUF4232 domain-containing protein [Streptomyces sp.]NUS89226.1 DUF4232 domain-containing protein [Streptomyces sp.]